MGYVKAASSRTWCPSRGSHVGISSIPESQAIWNQNIPIKSKTVFFWKFPCYYSCKLFEKARAQRKQWFLTSQQGSTDFKNQPGSCNGCALSVASLSLTFSDKICQPVWWLSDWLEPSFIRSSDKLYRLGQTGMAQHQMEQSHIAQWKISL